MYMYAYKAGSRGAKDLSAAIGARRIKHKNSKFKGNENKTVINWGSSSLPNEVMKCSVINHPAQVALASNKLKFFKAVTDYGGVNTPDWTENKEDVFDWMAEGHIVMAREKLTGHSGEGLIVCDYRKMELKEEVPDAPLYTKYVKKTDEYRVHIAFGKVVCVQRKARKKEVPDDKVNWKVRNLDNGFIFARNEGLETPLEIIIQSNKTMEALDLDFGAVDIIYQANKNHAVVIEVNTACGLVGQTLDDYVKAFNEEFNND